MNSYRYNDKEALNMVLEFEVKIDGGRTDDSDEEDEGEIEDATCIIKKKWIQRILNMSSLPLKNRKF